MTISIATLKRDIYIKLTNNGIYFITDKQEKKLPIKDISSATIFPVKIDKDFTVMQFHTIIYTHFDLFQIFFVENIDKYQAKIVELINRANPAEHIHDINISREMRFLHGVWKYWIRFKGPVDNNLNSKMKIIPGNLILSYEEVYKIDSAFLFSELISSFVHWTVKGERNEK